MADEVKATLLFALGPTRAHVVEYRDKTWTHKGSGWESYCGRIWIPAGADTTRLGNTHARPSWAGPDLMALIGEDGLPVLPWCLRCQRMAEWRAARYIDAGLVRNYARIARTDG